MCNSQVAGLSIKFKKSGRLSQIGLCYLILEAL